MIFCVSNNFTLRLVYLILCAFCYNKMLKIKIKIAFNYKKEKNSRYPLMQGPLGLDSDLTQKRAYYFGEKQGREVEKKASSEAKSVYNNYGEQP